MDWMRRTWARLLGFLFRRPGEAVLDEELRFHLKALAQDMERSGLSADEAWRQARLRLDVEGTKEAWRDQRSLPGLESTLLDVRHAARGLRRAPLFTIATVATLALGIAASTVVASLARGVLLNPLPYPEPERLVRVFETSARFPRFPMSPLNFADYERRAQVFAGFGAWTRKDMELSGQDRPVRLKTLQVSPGYFDVLGARPALGRAFLDRETRGEKARVVILSHALWAERFGSDPGVIGRVVRLDREDVTVVGVMPSGFEHAGGDYRSLPQGEHVDAWSPLSLDPAVVRRGWHYLNVVARLAPGVSPSQAEADLRRVAADLGREFEEAQGWIPRLVPLREEVVGGTRPAVLLLGAAVGLLLLIACANVTSLLLARATARRREIAVRHALGAGRSRLIGFGLAEAALLTAAGGAGGIVLARALLPVVRHALPDDFPRLHAVRLDPGVLLFALLLSCLVTLLLGLAPAVQGSLSNLRGALHGEGAQGTASRRTLIWRGAIVVGQTALACALLAGTALLGRSLETLLNTPPGFEPGGAIAFDIFLPEARYGSPEHLASLHTRLEERLLALPGARAAGLVTALPWSGWDENTGFGIVGAETPDRGGPNARFGAASTGLFAALGLPVRAGRGFTASDVAEGPLVVAINEALARKYFPGQDPLGRTLDLWGKKPTIVGVVGDLKDTPADLEAKPAFFWPMAQQPFSAASVVVRGGRPEALLQSVRAAVAEVDVELPVANLRPLDEVARAAHAQRRFLLAVVAIFAGLALALSGVGAYGTLAYAVECRRHEIGIRLALGADASRILRQVVGQGLRLAALGVGLGLTAALVLGRLAQSLLYGITPRDPLSLAIAGSVLLLVSGLAALLPGWRATRRSPATALRAE